MVEVFDLHQAEHKTIHLLPIPRGGAAVARRAHNPKVVGSNPTPATRKAKGEESILAFFVYPLSPHGTTFSLPHILSQAISYRKASLYFQPKLKLPLAIVIESCQTYTAKRTVCYTPTQLVGTERFPE